ncbi:MAG: hypothetical protein ACE5EE_09120 [Fidelibacterota bacterium]
MFSLNYTTFADPPPPITPPPECDPVPKVFCFRITDIRCEETDPEKDKFTFEFEVLNWSNKNACDLHLVLNTGTGYGSVVDSEPTFMGAGIDSNGRPIKWEDIDADTNLEGDTDDLEDTDNDGMLDGGEDKNGNMRLDNDPMPGNANPTNNWTVTSSSSTAIQYDAGTCIPFIDLVNLCLDDATHLPFLDRTDPETIDDGPNVLDGFKFTVDDFDDGEILSINWMLTDSDGNFIGTPSGGNAYGFGTINLARKDTGAPLIGTVFNGNTGFSQNKEFFFDSVYNVPGPCFSTFWLEFGAGIIAPKKNPEDPGPEPNVEPLVKKLAFVIDDTGSMGSEIGAVKTWLTTFVGLIETSGKTFPQTAIITFKDNVTQRICSNDPDQLRAIINSLFASGGGDCPEASNAALIAAAGVLDPFVNAVAIMATDANSRPDGPSAAAVVSAFLAKGATISVLLSSNCKFVSFSDKGYSMGDPVFQEESELPPEAESMIMDIINQGDDTLGAEDAEVTFSTVAGETGGIFKTLARPFSGDAETAYVNTATNVSVSTVVPAVSLVNPDDAPRGSTVSVEITGSNTSWTSSSIVAIGGFTSVVNSTTVNSPTSITANITIPSGAPTGFFDVTVTTALTDPLSLALGDGVTETAPGLGAFQITEPTGFATITSIIPSSGGQGKTVDLAISGIDTNFDATSMLSFRKDFADDTTIIVNSGSVDSPTSLHANITIGSGAELGFRDVLVTTGSEVVTKTNGLLVTTPPLDIPRITTVNPAIGAPGATSLDVAITGVNTNFVDGTSVANFSGTGITVVSTTVTSPTQATARINIDSSASLGVRDVSVTTGAETKPVFKLLNADYFYPVNPQQE